jgi:hypothetical protein
MYPTEPIGSAPPPPPQGLLDRDWQRILVFLLTLLAGAAVLWVLWQIVSPILRTLVLFALAAVLAFALSSPVNMVARRIGNRVAAIVLVYLLVGIIVVGHARLWPSQEHQCDNGRGEQRVVGRAAVVRRVGKERSHVFQDERAGVVVAQAADLARARLSARVITAATTHRTICFRAGRRSAASVAMASARLTKINRFAAKTVSGMGMIGRRRYDRRPHGPLRAGNL